MKQICDGYNPNVLMGNWYEQSFSVPQPARDQPIKLSRPKQIDIGFIDSKGRLKQLNTVARLQPWNTDKLLTAPQFSQNKCNNKTVMKQTYDLKIASNFHNEWKPQPFNKENTCNKNNNNYVHIDKYSRNHRLFNQKNINELLNQRKSDQESFKSSLKPNNYVNQKDLLQTIYQLHISQPAQNYPTFRNYKENGSFQSCTKQKGKQVEIVQLNESQYAKNFRRIRSEITLKTTTNFPFTYK